MRGNTPVLVALGAALAGGIAIAASGNAQFRKAADFIVPIGILWVNSIRMTVIPLVVSLIITGIAGATDLSAIGKLGGRTLVVFFLLLAGCAAVAVPFAPLVFALLPDGARPPLPPGATEAAGALARDAPQTFASWLTSLLPPNPIAAAANSAMVPLILFALLFALAVTRVPASSRGTLVDFFRATGDAMLVLVRWVVAAAPLGIFALILPLAAQQGASLIGAIGFYIGAYSLACIAVVILLYPVVAACGRMSVRAFARAALPAQLIAFSSSSSIASLPALVEGAERGLEIPNRIAGFVLPLAVSLFKLAAPVSWTVGALFVGWFYHVPLGKMQLATIAFAAVFLAAAGPGVPRGAFILLAPLFTAIGLPIEGLGILIAVDAIPDTFATVLNVTGNLAATAIVSRGHTAPAARSAHGF
jgi:Na+/H+-dicarboxylate symporter